MQRRFDIFIQLKFLHEYYKDQICPDFSLEPTRLCSKILKNNSMLFKPTADGAVILYETIDDSRSPIIPYHGSRELEDRLPSLVNTSLIFILKCNNPSFSQFTDYNALPAIESNSFYLFYYDKPNLVLKVKAISLKKPIFKYEFKTDEPNVSVQITDSRGELVIDKAIDRHLGPGTTALLPSYQFDLRDQPDGQFVISENAGGVSKRSEIYLTAEKYNNIFGLIELNVFDKPTLDRIYQVAMVLQFQFKVPKKIWRYYLVVKETDFSNYTYALEDKSSIPVTFSSKTLDDEHKQLLEVNDNRALLFVSDNVSIREEPRKIKLSKKKKPGGETILIMENLPNPTINNIRSEIILNV